jgi:hypothetical protein
LPFPFPFPPPGAPPPVVVVPPPPFVPVPLPPPPLPVPPPPPVLVPVPPPFVPVPPPPDEVGGTVVVVVGGIVVVVRAPNPATVLVGVGDPPDGVEMDTSATEALDPAAPVVCAAPAEPALPVKLGAGVLAGGALCDGVGVKVGTGAGAGASAEISGWSTGPGPTISPPTTDPAAATAATDAMNGLRGKNPGRMRRTADATTGLPICFGTGCPKLRDLNTSSRLAGSSGIAGPGVDPSIFLHQVSSKWRGR